MARRARPAAPATGVATPAGSVTTSPAGLIDALYQQPLASFTAARNDLARSLARAGASADAARVKALTKPAVVPWAVNQVYWHARSIWDRLIAAGQAVRAAQISALEQPGAPLAHVQRGRAAVHDATTAHRTAIADAVHQAVRLAGQANTRPNADELARMLEAVSLAASPPGAAGRFTEAVQPAGFEALLGITPLAGPAPPRPRTHPPATVTPLGRRDPHATDHAAAQAARRAQIDAARIGLATARSAALAADAAERQAADALADAELRVTQAQAHLRSAQSAARTAREARANAEQALARLTPDA